MRAMTKLDRLTADIRACRLCVESPLKTPLPHEPRPVLRVSPTARICIAGQAPGTRVHASGMPFTDPSGDRLRDWMGVTPDEFYDDARIAIVPMGFCFPGHDAKGGDLPPRRECAETWHEPLFKHLPQLELILLVGQYAQAWHLGRTRKVSLTETVAAWREYQPRFIPLPHPSWRNNAWIKKNPWFEEDLLPVLKRDVRRLIG
ncbi:uracil-DNA glycosylase family protein [Parvibaculum sp.]|jgi:uracil-DNA glycosylase|uniref:uracil-DNA glycosylase family protein n=1 Tax=Parvibaculum sp. TaxID=2024848 RepID=UPI000C5A05C3|nr:uracil-DNA glycosylase family protein [Parvibaculum sp.]MAM94653.1 uracil-DNA glycosylase [Parvibaculum sp.]HCX69505.1 uracil-DNA glycosylase [Rhodobiaceae bacterium]